MHAPLPAAIQASLELLRGYHWMMGSSAGSGQPFAERIEKVVAAFDAAGARWVLVGAHAVGILTEPRATSDFDFVVDQAKLDEVIRRLEGEFGDLDIDDIGSALRLRAIDVDLIRSSAHALFRVALEERQPSDRWHIPTREMLVVLKFLAAISPWRAPERRARDLADLIALVRARRLGPLDGERVLALARQVYPGAEREIGDLLGRIDRGEPIAI